MDRNDPTPRYTRGELLEAMNLAAGVASGVFMRKHPRDVMPSEELSQGIEAVLEEFDIRRGRERIAWSGSIGAAVKRVEGEVERARGETRIGYPRSDEPEPRTYTRSQLEAVARAAVREAAEEAEPDRVEQLAGRALREFDSRAEGEVDRARG